MSGDAPSPAGTRTRKVSPARMEKYRAERDAIMRAAYDLIQRNGSKETSVHDVLRETGYSTALRSTGTSGRRTSWSSRCTASTVIG